MSAPTRWLVVRVEAPTDPDLAALVSETLIGLGGSAVLEEGPWLVTHVPEPADPGAWLEGARHDLAAVRPSVRPRVETEWQAQQDWAHYWKRGLRPRAVTERVVVSPSWCRAPLEAGQILVTIDPGMAFGTAEHATTRACIRLLDAVVRAGDRVLDVGAGSGILSIVAAKVGAGRVLGLETDPWSVEAARRNVARNDVGEVVTVEQCAATADLLRRTGTWNLVVANIESSTLGSLLPGFRHALRAGGRLVLGGVVRDEWNDLCAAAGGLDFDLLEIDDEAEWRSGVFTLST